MERISKTVLHLIIINAVLLLITELHLIPNIDLTHLLALHYFENTHFGWWQYVSYMFMHGGFTHLLFNMYALWAFGTPLENIWGRGKFLFFYFSCGIGAALLHTIINYYYVHQGLEALQNVGVSTEEVISALSDRKYLPMWETIINKSTFDNMAAAIATPTVGASGASYTCRLRPHLRFYRFLHLWRQYRSLCSRGRRSHRFPHYVVLEKAQFR